MSITQEGDRTDGPLSQPQPDTRPASTVIVADPSDWDTSPCPGHLPFDSCGPAISAEPWPEPPGDREPRYASVRVAEVSAACGSPEVAYALLDLERDLDLGTTGPAGGDGR